MSRQNIRTASELGHATGVDQSLISRWLRDGVRPSIENLRRIQPALRVPLNDLLVAAGHVEEAEAPETPQLTLLQRHMATVLEAIDADPDLLPEAKTHLKNQYGLLLRIQAHRDPAHENGLPELQPAARRPGERPSESSGSET